MLKKVVLIVISLILSFTLLYAQKDQGYLEVRGSVKYDRAALRGAKVEVYRKGVKEKVYPIEDNGKFSIKLDLNNQYDLVVRKQGFFSKKLNFNTTVPAEDVGIWTYKFAMKLFPEIVGFDASLLDEPIGKIKFVNKVGDFDYDEDYTNSMLRRLKSLMKEYEKARHLQFEKVVAQADQAFKDKKYDEAIELYDQAIDLDPYDPYPDDQIYMISKLIREDENAEKNYQKNIKEADRLFSEQSYIDSKKYYKRALNYKKERYPNDQITAIDKILNDQDALEAELAAKNKAYMEKIASADRSYQAKQYQPALSKYTEASQIKPNEQYPKDRIDELNKLIAEQNANIAEKEQIEKAYQEAIQLADGAFNAKKYQEAKANYIKANDLKPEEQYPKRKILEIDNILAANKSIEEKYKGFIQVADNALAVKEYEISKKNYQQALSIKPNEQYPKDKINEIDNILRLMADRKKEELDAAYQRAVALGDAEFNKKSYEQAKQHYTNALSLRNTEAYPKQRIAEIDQRLAEIAAKRRAYDLAIARADNNYNIEKWAEAKVDYQEALGIFPDEQYPRTRINEIDNALLEMKNAKEQRAAREKAYQEAVTLGDNLLSQKKYQESKNAYAKAQSVKPNETYPKQKIAEIERLIIAENARNQKYNNIIQTADQYFVDQQYQQAKATYSNALAVKPNEQYPKDKISEIDVILAKQLAEKSKRDEIQKQYDLLITQANNRYNNKDWQPAKGLYQQASALKPDEVLPKQRIVEIDNLLAGIAEQNQKYQQAISNADQFYANEALGEALAQYQVAATIKPEETYPKTQIAEINRLLEKQRQDAAAYDNYIKLADAALQNSKLQTAKSQYQEALTLKPDQAYPKQKIQEIDALIAQQQAAKTKREQIQKQYDQFIAQADANFVSKDYQDAKAFYQQAITVKPNEIYPKQRISEIDHKLTVLAEKEKQYRAKLSEGQGFIDAKNYRSALTAYQEAANIKPDEQLPKQKMAQIQQIIQASERKNQQYKVMIAQADNLFKQEKYNQAKPIYQQAKTLLPEKKYPQEQIAQIDKLLAEQAKKDAEQRAVLQAYQVKIKEADNSFAQKAYEPAIAKYREAKGIKPDETYPDQQIARINQILQQNAAKLDTDFKAAIALGDNYRDKQNFDMARQQYLVASNLKPNDALPKSRLSELKNLIDQANLEKQKQQRLDHEYNNYITQADNALKTKDYSSAIAIYKSALGVKPNEGYPKKQIELCENKIQEQKALAAAEAEKRRQSELNASKQSFNKDDFDYKGEQRDQRFLNELAKKYPEGVTRENYDKKNKKILRVIVNHGGIAKEYIQVKYSYGTFYFRNGQNISRSIFLSETKE